MTSPFNLEESFTRARERFGRQTKRKRKTRSDQGAFRIKKDVTDMLTGLLSGPEFPGVHAIITDLSEQCLHRGLPCPSRSTIYKFIQRDKGQSSAMDTLPRAVRAALYNLSGSASVPNAQLVFYCLNYGDLEAIQYAAAMPWWPIYQAARMRGWRPKSRGLLNAVLRARRISRV